VGSRPSALTRTDWPPLGRCHSRITPAQASAVWARHDFSFSLGRAAGGRPWASRDL